MITLLNLVKIVFESDYGEKRKGKTSAWQIHICPYIWRLWSEFVAIIQPWGEEKIKPLIKPQVSGNSRSECGGGGGTHTNSMLKEWIHV